MMSARRLRLEAARGVGDARTFELKDALRVAPAEHLEGLLVVEGNGVEVDVLRFEGGLRLAQNPFGLVQKRQRSQAQEVHLDQPDVFDRFHVVLTDHADAGGVAHHRHQVGQLVLADDHARRVNRGVAGQTFELLGKFVGFEQLLVLGQELLNVRHGVAGLLQRVALAELDRNQLADLVHLGVFQTHHAGHVLEAGLARHRSEGGDLGDFVFAVLLLHVVDDFHPAGVVEVDVEIRHRDAVGVEEALEQQLEFQRIEVGDPHGVGHQRPRARPAPRPHADALILGPVDVVGHDQKVIGKAHVVDDAQLVLGAAQQHQRRGCGGRGRSSPPRCRGRAQWPCRWLHPWSLPVQAGVFGQRASFGAGLHDLQRRIQGVLLARRLAPRFPLAAQKGDQGQQGVRVATRRVAAATRASTRSRSPTSSAARLRAAYSRSKRSVMWFG